MSYTSLTEKLKILPEDCLKEIDNYVEYVIYKFGIQNKEKTSVNNMSKFFGSINNNKDGLAIQKALRNEWN